MTHVEKLVTELNEEAEQLELAAGVQWRESVDSLRIVNDAQDKRLFAARLESAIIRDRLESMGGAA